MTKVFKREGSSTGYQWLQFLVIEDAKVFVVDMKPAILSGWNYDRVELQQGDDWAGMTAEEIIAWKEYQYPGDLIPCDPAQAESVLAHLSEKALRSGSAS